MTKHCFLSNISYTSPKHYIKRYTQKEQTLKNSSANKFSKMAIAIPFNLLQVSPSPCRFVFVILFRPPFDVSSGHLCFPQFGGSSHCLNFYKFRDTAPLSFDPPDVICKVVRYDSRSFVQKEWVKVHAPKFAPVLRCTISLLPRPKCDFLVFNHELF